MISIHSSAVFIAIAAALFVVAGGQVKIEKKESDGGVWRKSNESAAADREIYTSTHELAAFFARERDYVEDLRAVMDKKLVSAEARGAVGAYVASYEDVVGEQGGNSTTLKIDRKLARKLARCAI